MKELLLAGLGAVFTISLMSPEVLEAQLGPRDLQLLALALLFLALGLNGLLSHKARLRLQDAQVQLAEFESLKADLETAQAELQKTISDQALLSSQHAAVQAEQSKLKEQNQLQAQALQRVEAEAVILKDRVDQPGPVLALLQLLQEKGRFLDFVMNDIAAIPDERVGAVARMVHDGCRQVLEQHLSLEPVSQTPEGTAIELEADYQSHAYRLLGQVGEDGPYKGQLLHQGWQTTRVELPAKTQLSGSQGYVIAPAEVEVRGGV